MKLKDGTYKPDSPKKQLRTQQMMLLRQITAQRAQLGMVVWAARQHCAIEIKTQVEFIDSALEAIEVKVREVIARAAPNSEIAAKLKEYKARNARERSAL